MKFSIRSLAAFAVTCLLALLVGCGNGGGGGSTGTTGSTGTISRSAGETGTLAVSLTDAPNIEYRAVYVTIDRVEVHLGGNEASPNNWQTITPPESGVTGFVKKTFNLMDLRNGILEELGTTELPAGFYTQMRLFLATEPDDGLNILGLPHEFPNYVIVSGTNDVHELKVPSGYQTGIKLVKGFTVGENQLTELIIDFDAEKSVVPRGNSGKEYILKPTIKVLGTEVLGYFIEGTVFDDQDNPLEGALVSAQKSYPPAVNLDPKDEVVVVKTDSTDVNGGFRLLVPPGIYNIVAYKDTYDFAFRCGVNAAIEAVSGVPIEFILPDLGSGVTEYGYVGGSVNLAGGGLVAISFRAPECGLRIELKSKIIDVVPEESALYEQILPVSEEPYYQVVASSEGKDTQVVSGVTVESGVSTIINFNF